MNARIKLASVIIPLGILVAAIPDDKVMAEKANPQQILSEIKEGSHLVSTDAVAAMLIEKNPSLQLIDVRSASEYDAYHLPGAISVTVDNILSDENTALFDQDVVMNVLYSNGTSAAVEAWMLLRQKGFRSLYVMEGGMNHWAETIMNPTFPSASGSNDELARYDFRKAAGGALGGGGGAALQPAVTASAPAGTAAPKAGAPKKKRAAGGC